MSLDLNTATDAEINSLVAEHVAGWTYHGYNPDIKDEATLCWTPPNREYDPMRSVSLPRYTTDANAVLELLEEYSVMVDRVCYEEWLVIIDPSDAPDDGSDYTARASAATFPRAACLALLRAKGLG